MQNKCERNEHLFKGKKVKKSLHIGWDFHKRRRRQDKHFTLPIQKVTFRRAKGNLLRHERPPFAAQKAAFRNWAGKKKSRNGPFDRWAKRNPATGRSTVAGRSFIIVSLADGGLSLAYQLGIHPLTVKARLHGLKPLVDVVGLSVEPVRSLIQALQCALACTVGNECVPLAVNG